MTGVRKGGKNVGMPQEERALISDVERRLAEKYSALPTEHVTTVVRHAYSQFQSSRVRGFIPLLVQRRADEELEELVEVIVKSVLNEGLLDEESLVDDVLEGDVV